MHTAKTYGCVRLIETALQRPAHRPRIIRPHLADEYAEATGRDEKETRELRGVALELKRPWRYMVPISIKVTDRG